MWARKKETKETKGVSVLFGFSGALKIGVDLGGFPRDGTQSSERWCRCSFDLPLRHLDTMNGSEWVCSYFWRVRVLLFVCFTREPQGIFVCGFPLL